MNEELLYRIYTKLGIKSADFKTFSNDVINDPAIAKRVYDKLGVKSANFETFYSDLKTPSNYTNLNNNPNVKVRTNSEGVATKFDYAVEKPLIDKFAPVGKSSGLVITGAASPNHYSEAQRSGKSIDVNFEDGSTDPNKIYKAFKESTAQGLMFQYETKDQGLFNKLKAHPEYKNYKNNIVDPSKLQHISGNHFSVYYGQEPVKQQVTKTKAGDFAVKTLPTNITDPIQLVNNRIKETVITTVDAKTGHSRLKVITKEEAFDQLVKEGTIDVTKLSQQEIINITGKQAYINSLQGNAKTANERLRAQLNDEGMFESMGDAFHYLTGKGSLDGLTLKTDKGKIYLGQTKNHKDIWVTPQEALNLKYNPVTDNQNPQDYNNKYLRRVQDIIIQGDKLNYDAQMWAANKKINLLNDRQSFLDSKLKNVIGVKEYSKFTDLQNKARANKLTPEEGEVLKSYISKINNAGLISDFDSLEEAYKTTVNFQNNVKSSYSRVDKLELLRGAIKVENDARRKKMSYTAAGLEEAYDIFTGGLKAITDMPGDVTRLAATGFDAVIPGDQGSAGAAIRKAYATPDKIRTSKEDRTVFEEGFENKEYDVRFKNGKADAIFDKDGYNITRVNDSRLTDANKELEGGRKIYGFFNPVSLGSGFADTAPQLISILAGGYALKGATMLGAAQVANAASTGARVNRAYQALDAVSKSGRALESMSVVPAFTQQMMNDAIKSGEVFTAGQIFTATSTHLAQEALIESIFAGPWAKILGANNITREVATRHLRDNLTDVMRHLAAGKITNKDFAKHLGSTLKELVKDGVSEGLEEGIAELTTPILDTVLNATIDSNFDVHTPTLNDTLSAVAIGAVSGLAMAGPTFASKMIMPRVAIREQYSNLLNEVIRQTADAQVRDSAVTTPEIFDQVVAPLVQAGTITQEKADKYSSAIQKAGQLSKFATELVPEGKEEEGSQRMFNTVVRNIAYESAMNQLAAGETSNEVTKAQHNAVSNSYKKELEQLEKNAAAGIFSTATATNTINKSKLKVSDTHKAKLNDAYDAILQSIASKNVSEGIKSKLLGVELQKALTKIVKNEPLNLPEVTEQEQAVQTQEIQTLEETSSAIDTNIQQEIAQEAKVARAEQGVSTKTDQQENVDDFFNNYQPTVDSVTGKKVINRDLIDQLIEENPELEDQIHKKVSEISNGIIKEQTDAIVEASRSVPDITVAGIEKVIENPAGATAVTNAVQDVVVDLTNQITELSQEQTPEAEAKVQELEAKIEAIQTTPVEELATVVPELIEKVQERLSEAPKDMPTSAPELTPTISSNSISIVDKKNEVIDVKKENLVNALDSLSDDLLYIVHVTNDNNAVNIFNSSLLMPAGITSTTGIVSKEKLKELVLSLYEGVSPHRGYLDLFIGAISKTELNNQTGRTLSDKLDNYIVENHIEDSAKNQLPSVLNYGYYTNGVLTIPSNTNQENKPKKRSNKTRSYVIRISNSRPAATKVAAFIEINDPVYITKTSKGIEAIVYFDNSTNRFVSKPIDLSNISEISLGQYDANQGKLIPGSNNMVRMLEASPIGTSIGVSINKTPEVFVASFAKKRKLTPEELDELLPNMFVLGMRSDSERLEILQNEPIDGLPIVSILKKFPNLSPESLKLIEAKKEDGKYLAAGKVVLFIEDRLNNQTKAILFDTVTPSNNKKYLEQLSQDIDELVTRREELKGDSKQDPGLFQINKLYDTRTYGVVEDIEGANIRGVNRELMADATGLYIKNPDKPKSKQRITKEEYLALAEKSRVHVDHDMLRNPSQEEKEFILDVLEVPVNNKNEIFSVNVAMNISQSPQEVENTISEQDLPNTIVGEEVPKASKPKRKDTNNDVLFSTGSTNNTGSLQEGLDWLKSVNPNVQPEIVQGLIDGIANGSYNSNLDLITLSEEFANKSTVKHEMLHLLMNSLPFEQREAILNDAAEKYNVVRNDVGDLAIEEKIAEEAENSKDEIVAKTPLQKFIQSIRNLLRNIFKEKDKVSRLFRDMNQGRLNSNNKNNTNQGTKYQLSNYSPSKRDVLSKLINREFFSKYLYTEFGSVSLNKAISSKNSADDIIKNFIDKLPEYVNQYINSKDLDEDIIEELIKLPQGVKTDKYLRDKTIAEIKKARFIGGDTTDTSDQTEDEATEKEQVGDPENFTINRSKTDSRKGASAALREFFSLFPQKTLAKKDGKFVRNTLTDNDYLNNKYYSGEFIHNNLLKLLSNSSDSDTFIDKLNNLTKEYSWSLQLIQAILNISETEANALMDKGQLKVPKDIITNADKYPNYNTWIIKDMYIAIADQANRDVVVILDDPGRTNSSLVNKVEDDEKKTAIETLQSLLETISPEAKQEVLSLVNKITKDGYTYGNINNLFNIIGYPVQGYFITQLSDNFTIKNISSGKENSVKQFFLYSLNDLKSFLTTGERAYLTDLTSDWSTLISKYQNISSGLSYLDTEQELNFAHRPSNYIIRQFDQIKKDVKSWVKDRTIYNGYPVIFLSENPMANDVVNFKYDLVEDGGTGVKGQSNSGSLFANLNKRELLAQTLNIFGVASKTSKSDGNQDTNRLTNNVNLPINHGFFSVGVYSDAPTRPLLQAPIFSTDEILNRFYKLIKAETNRIQLHSEGHFAKFDNLKQNGGVYHILPRLNDVKINGNISFYDFISPYVKTNVFNVPLEAVTIDGVIYSNSEVLRKSAGNPEEFIKFVITELINNDYKDYYSMLQEELLVDVPKKVSLLTLQTNKIKDFYLNQYYHSAAFSLMFVGDPASYKKNKLDSRTNIEMVKRFKQLISPGIKRLFDKPNYTQIVFQDIQAYSDIFKIKGDLSDAGAYHTISRRLDILKSENKLSPQVEESLNRINDGTYTLEDLKSINRVIKPFVYTMLNSELPGTAYSVSVPYQVKNSEVLLLPTEAYQVDGSDRFVRPTSLQDIENGKYIRPDLAKILFLMESTNTDVATFISATKAEKFFTNDLDSITDPSQLQVVTLSNEDWNEQQLVPDKFLSVDTNDASQQWKHMTANVDPNLEFTYTESDGSPTIYKGQKGVNSLMAKLMGSHIRDNWKKYVGKITDKNGNLDIKKIAEIIYKSQLDKNVDSDVLEGLEIQEDYKSLVPFELMSRTTQKSLNAIVKKVHKFKSRGAALVNMPSVGFINRKKDKVSYQEDLQVITNDKGDILYWEAILPVYDDAIFDYIDQQGNLLLDESGKPLLPEKYLRAFLYRIPTEDKYSMFPVKIKKFSMPASGGVIILPTEATIMAGLDFDVDKLFGSFYNFKVKRAPQLLNWVKGKLDQSLKSLPNKELELFIDTFEKINNLSINESNYQEDVEELLENINDGQLENYEAFKVAYPSIKSSYDYTLERYYPNNRSEIIEIPSTLDTKLGRDNLLLDLYFAISQTKAFSDSAKNPGNKDRLTALRNEAVANQEKGLLKSPFDPTQQIDDTVKNQVGKKLIGIFANASSFYSLLQGNSVLQLRKPLKLELEEYVDGKYTTRTVTFTSLGAPAEQISKNIAENLFASTEDVKDPVLEILNINLQTAPVLAAMLMLIDDTGKPINFEAAVKFLSNQELKDTSILNSRAGTKMSSNQFDGQLEEVMEIVDVTNQLINRLKLDAEVGPTFFDVSKKVTDVYTLEKSKKANKVFKNHTDILPINGGSDIEISNDFFSTLEKEIELFKQGFSFLLPGFQNITDGLQEYAAGSSLNADRLSKITNYIYDALIQNYIAEKGKTTYINTEFINTFINYEFTDESAILKSILLPKGTKLEMVKMIIKDSDKEASYKAAFAELFESDPEFAQDLALHALSSGTGFTLNGFSNLIPSVFYTSPIGKDIRDMINGTTTEKKLTQYNITYEIIIQNHFENISPKVNKDQVTRLDEVFYNITSPHDFVWLKGEKVKVLFKDTGNGWLPLYQKDINNKDYNYVTGISNFTDNLDDVEVTEVVGPISEVPTDNTLSQPQPKVTPKDIDNLPDTTKDCG